MMTSTQVRGSRDSYIIERKLGEGGFGETFLARSESEQQVVVVKRLRIDRLDDWKAMELFERESSVLATLDHPGVPRYVDAFEDPEGSGLMLVQEYIEGRTLRDVMRAEEQLDEASMTRWFLEVLEVCAYLHALDPPVIHRDVNPNNIILRDHDSEAFLIDFGTVQAAIRSESTVSSTSAGTFGYAPTEQFIGKAYPSSDLYGLAMTFLALWTRTEPEAMPFGQGEIQLDELLSTRPLDGRLKLALERMIDRVPEKRPQSADEVLDRLAALRPTAPAAAPNKTVVVSTPSEAVSEASEKPWVEAKARLERINPDALLGDVAPAQGTPRDLRNWALSSDGAQMLLTRDGSGRLVDTAKMTTRLKLRGFDSNDALGIAPDNRFIIAFNGWGEYMTRFDLTEGGRAETFEIPRELHDSSYCGPEASVAISPDNALAALGSPLALFSPQSGALIRITELKSEALPCFAPDGGTLVGVNDGTVELMAMDGSSRSVEGTCFAYSADGRRAALGVSGSSGCRVLVGDPAKLTDGSSNWSDQSWEIPDTDGGEILRLCFAPSGRWIAVGVSIKHTFPGESDWTWASRVSVIDTQAGRVVTTIGDPSRAQHALKHLYGLGFDASSERLFVLAYCFPTVHDQHREVTLIVHDFKRNRVLALVDERGIRTPEGFFEPLPDGPRKRASNSDPYASLAWCAACGESPETVLSDEALECLLDLRQRVEFVQELFGDTIPSDSDVRALLGATRGLTHLLPWIVEEARREAAALPRFGASSNEGPPVRTEHLLNAANRLVVRSNSEREALFEEMIESLRREARAEAEAEAEARRAEARELIEDAIRVRPHPPAAAPQQEVSPAQFAPAHSSLPQVRTSRRRLVMASFIVVSVIAAVTAMFMM